MVHAAEKPKNFVRGLSLPDKMPVVMVNESGASIYSASAVAREDHRNRILQCAVQYPLEGGYWTLSQNW